jgi:carboxynorspermidine decarboxylase
MRSFERWSSSVEPGSFPRSGRNRMVAAAAPLTRFEADRRLDDPLLEKLLAVPTTPAFVYDENRLHEAFALLESARGRSGCKILYSIKALPFAGVLGLAADYVDGLSVSSLFEARLAHEVLSGQGSIHITTPGLRTDEMAEITSLCDFISFNSLPQWERFRQLVEGCASAGLRVNPQRSFLDDARYDPCRPYSKLGVPLPQIRASFVHGVMNEHGVEGLHLHTACELRSFEPLRETVRHIERELGGMIRGLLWINLGGGYLFDQPDDLRGLFELVDYLRDKWQVDVYFEPGKAVVGEAGYLVASVIDLYESDEKTIAVLDTSVNHLPEVFEYQRRPELVGEESSAPYSLLLAGCTCLAGDLFGEYHFSRPCRVGDRLVFSNVGAYSLIKANRFNGYNLPAIYAYDPTGRLQRMKSYDYADYRRQWTEEGYI